MDKKQGKDSCCCCWLLFTSLLYLESAFLNFACSFPSPSSCPPLQVSWHWHSQAVVVSLSHCPPLRVSCRTAPVHVDGQHASHAPPCAELRKTVRFLMASYIISSSIHPAQVPRSPRSSHVEACNTRSSLALSQSTTPRCDGPRTLLGSTTRSGWRSRCRSWRSSGSRGSCWSSSPYATFNRGRRCS